MMIDDSRPMLLDVNGHQVSVHGDPATPLVYVLRNQLGLTATRMGCGLEQCGACSVLLDGEVATSCTLTLGECTGHSIITVEGLSEGGRPNALQASFIEHGAAQCGYCTSGILIAATALLKRNPQPDEREVCAALEPNLCRCGAHRRVVAAVLAAAGEQTP